MAINTEQYLQLTALASQQHATLVAVSKTKPVADIQALYQLGQRDFGENYVQELTEKQTQLPTDIRWHFIGHLQTNKVKYIAPFVHLVHGVDSLKLLQEINKQAQKNNRIIDCLLQVYIAKEETKFGLDEEELQNIMEALEPLAHIKITGFMGMASFSSDVNVVRKEFNSLKVLFDTYKQITKPNFQLQHLSMGMSGDYQLALEEGSTMVRIGSLLFGARNYQQ